MIRSEKDLEGVRIVAVTFDTQAPDVYFRRSPSDRQWLLHGYDPHDSHRAYICREVSVEELIEAVSEIRGDHSHLNTTKFTGR